MNLRFFCVRTKVLLLFSIFCLVGLLAACNQTATPVTKFNVTLASAPEGRNGDYLTVQVMEKGEPITDATVSLQGDMTHAGMAPVIADGVQDDADGKIDGSYQVPFTFSMAGDWVITVSIERAGTAETHEVRASVNETDIVFEEASGQGDIPSVALTNDPQSTTTSQEHLHDTNANDTNANSTEQSHDSQAIHAIDKISESEKVTAEDPDYLSTLTIALYLLNSAGFHEIAVVINEEKVLRPEYTSVTGYSHHLVSAIEWPEKAIESANNLASALIELQAALHNNDLTAAIPAAEAVHESEHDLDHFVSQWLAKQKLAPDAPLNRFAIVAVALIFQQMDFPGIANAIEQGEIGGTNKADVYAAQQFLTAIAWPQSVQEQLHPLLETLSTLADGMEFAQMSKAKAASKEAVIKIEQFLDALANWEPAASSIMDPNNTMQVAIAHQLLNIATHSLKDKPNAGVAHWANTLLTTTLWPSETHAINAELNKALIQFEQLADISPSEDLTAAYTIIETQISALEAIFSLQHGE